MALIDLQGLHKRFGSLDVIKDVSLQLSDGEALGIIGPNGAGKTTLFNLITGTVTPDGGRIVFDGADITDFTVHRRSHLGIGRSFQIPHPFAKMTVFENVLVGAVFGARSGERDAYERCVDLLQRTGMLDRANRLAGELTLLERKRLELARALATEPRVLLLDEIASGLTEHEIVELVETIRAIHDAGTSIVWIEHVVHALVSMVRRLVVLDFGVKIAEGNPAEVINSADVQQVYLGIDIDEPAASLGA